MAKPLATNLGLPLLRNNLRHVSKRRRAEHDWWYREAHGTERASTNGGSAHLTVNDPGRTLGEKPTTEAQCTAKTADRYVGRCARPRSQLVSRGFGIRLP